ncbi:hypothetical protein ACFQY5_08085 [Paeniroseomonas aquatica]|uniref:hypothetical protein n=1 Tax=Paeniroseomonas aquatica TaxID=373043 RepID=UPI00361681E8
MPMTRRRALAAPALLLAGPAWAQTSVAQGFPSRPVRMVVPYTPAASPTSPRG